MKHILFFAFLLTSFVSEALSFDDVVSALSKNTCRRGTVEYEVYLPTASDPVVYTINFISVAPGDEYSECSYLINWTLPRGNKTSEGFSSYHNGDHFRYRDARLQEYHVEEDALPFSTEDGGVARSSQFADLLPPFIAAKLLKMEGDSTYRGTYNPETATLSGVQRVKGYDAMEYEYVFDTNTGLPLKLDFVYNPAGISEQLVTATYSWTDSNDNSTPIIDEAFLIDRYGEIFEKYRESDFRAENLPGTPMPNFSFTSLGGQRIIHTKGENDMTTPSLMVFLDSTVAGTRQTVESVRNAVATLPVAVTTIYAFARGDVPDGFNATETEGVVKSPQGLIRKCGITAFPTLLLLEPDGTVSDVIIGMDADLITLLSQKIMLL